MVAALKIDSTDNSAKLESLGITPLSRVIVVGLGITGLSVVRYLLQQGIIPTVVDSRQQPPGLDQLLQDVQRQWSQLEIVCGVHAFDNLQVATHLIISPGVSLKTAEINQASLAGISILNDIDLFAIAASAPIIAITGSNGKTTVTTLVGKMIESTGKTAAVGGNIGTPVLDLLQPTEPDVYVLELSSFQLETTRHLQPAVAVVLNISADHMDRYDDLEDYVSAKARIFNDAEVIIDNFNQPVFSQLDNTNQHSDNQCYFGVTENKSCHFRLGMIENHEWLFAYEQPLMPVSEVAMHGRHNLSNALAALALVEAVDMQTKATLNVLRQFSGLPHRMEAVRELNGVQWINDSKATNIGACDAALLGMTTRVILIAGGDGKGADFSELSTTVNTKVSELIVLGKDADRLQIALHAFVNIHRVNTIEQAVKLAADLAQSGDVVLLSPACASLDQFENYQARGDVFIHAVMELPL